MFAELLRLFGKDSLLRQALRECNEMIGMCQRMVRASVTSLRETGDGEVDIDVPELDKSLNSFERDVRRKVMTHLSLGNQPDIASGLVLVSIVIDLERIGDYAKNIYDLAIAHPTRFVAGRHEPDLVAIETIALENFDRCAEAFKAGDADEARLLMKEYKADISKQCRVLERTLLDGDTDLQASDAVTLALYLRFLKRISAHSRNLVSSVVNPVDRIGYSE